MTHNPNNPENRHMPHNPQFHVWKHYARNRAILHAERNRKDRAKTIKAYLRSLWFQTV